MTVRHMDCLQGQDVTQEAVTGITTETNIHTTALMSSYASTQATSNSRPAATSVAVTVQPTEPSGASQSSGAGSSTSLPPPGGITGTNTPHTLATTLKAGSPPVGGCFSPLLLPAMVLTCCLHN